MNISVTIGGGKFFFVGAPYAWVTVAGIFASIIVNLQSAIEELQAEKDNLNKPSIYNNCLDFQNDPLIIDGVRMSIESLQGEFNTMSNLMIVYCTLMLPSTVLFVCIVMGFICPNHIPCGTEMLGKNLKDCKDFFYTHYPSFN